MNIDRMKALIGALRSGKYTQIRGALFGGPGEYCAVGVGLLTAHGSTAYAHISCNAMEALDQWLDLSVGNMMVHLNDGQKWNFADIADYLESQLPKRDESIPESVIEIFKEVEHA